MIEQRPDYLSEDEWQEFLRERKPKPAEGEPRARRKPLNGERKSAGRIAKALNNKRADAPEWMRDACFDHKGVLVPNVASAMAALRSAPQISGCFAYDEMMRAPVIVNHIPGETDKTVPRPLTDDDVTLLQEWPQKQAGLTKIGKDTCHQAVDLRAHERAFHPVRDYLDGLVWDRRPRLGTWLAYYLGAEQTPLPSASDAPFLLRWWRGYSNPVASKTTC